MANSIQYAKTVSTPSVKLATNELTGRVRVAFAEYEASAEQGTINMFVLPTGARIVRSRNAHDALGGSTTLSVGHAAYVTAAGVAVVADVDEYLAATASTGAVGHDVANTIALGENSVTDANEDGVTITATMAGGNCTGTIQLSMFYVLD
tara:strand:+ start:875 stop:1324 length:450 start_codon:yes stop_codon:yes gene_type:complete